jgi:hypothetical protein
MSHKLGKIYLHEYSKILVQVLPSWSLSNRRVSHGSVFDKQLRNSFHNKFGGERRTKRVDKCNTKYTDTPFPAVDKVNVEGSGGGGDESRSR